MRDQVCLLRQVFDARVLLPQSYSWSTKGAEAYPKEVTILPYLSPGGTRMLSLRTFMLHKSILDELGKEKSKPDLIHIHFAFPSGLVIPRLRESGYENLILSFHGSDWYAQQDHPDLLRRIRNSVEASSIVTVPSARLKSDIQQKWTNLNTPIKVLGNVVDDQLLTMVSKAEKVAQREDLGWELEDKHLICVANVVPVKGLDVLLDALGQREQLKQYHLHIIGGQPDESYKKELGRRIEQLGLEKIHFYEPRSRELLAKMYGAADLFVQSSRSEGGGLALMEAICSGLPIVATNTGHAPELIHEGNGSIVTPENPEQMAKAIESTLDQKHWNGLVQARSNVVAEYGRDVMVERLKRMYEEAMRNE